MIKANLTLALYLESRFKKIQFLIKKEKVEVKNDSWKNCMDLQ